MARCICMYMYVFSLQSRYLSVLSARVLAILSASGLFSCWCALVGLWLLALLGSRLDIVSLPRLWCHFVGNTGCRFVGSAVFYFVRSAVCDWKYP